MKITLTALLFVSASLAGAGLGHVVRPVQGGKPAAPAQAQPQQPGANLDYGPPVMYALFANGTCVQWPRTINVDPVTGKTFETYDAVNVPGWTVGQPIPAWVPLCPKP